MAINRASQSSLQNSAKYRNVATNIKVVATGGTITKIPGYTVHTFTDSGVFEILWSSTNTVNVQYMVVAGGGGSRFNGGGGAGGYRLGGNVLTLSGSSGANAAIESPLSLARGSHTVTIGAGGPSGAAGVNTSFSTITSTGGGIGGARAASNATSGGSGGGGGSSNPVGAGGAAGTAGQGFAGGGGGPDAGGDGWGGGGGGAAGGGSSGGTGSATGKFGGIGQEAFIRGVSERFAGGGAPMRNSNVGVATGGLGGGGNTGVSGAINTGGGGGGGGLAGGSGIVIVRYES